MTETALDEVGALVHELRTIEAEYGSDPEIAHGLADDALLSFIEKVTGSSGVTEAFDEITKWYA